MDDKNEYHYHEQEDFPNGCWSCRHFAYPQQDFEHHYHNYDPFCRAEVSDCPLPNGICYKHER